jgi:hypothetical protein
MAPAAALARGVDAGKAVEDAMAAVTAEKEMIALRNSNNSDNESDEKLLFEAARNFRD